MIVRQKSSKEAEARRRDMFVDYPTVLTTICKECGVVVASEDLHFEWHKTEERRLIGR